MSYRTAPAETLPFVYVAFTGYIVALQREGGARVWLREMTGRHPRIAVDGGRVYVLGGSLACLDAATGKTLWNVYPPPPGDAMLVHGEQVFVGGVGHLTCISALDGKVLWDDEFEGMGQGDLAIAVDGLAAQSDRSG